jgi:4-amino-4-deoxychorismate lyase
VARWADDGDDAVLRLVLGRGRGATPIAFVTVSAVPASAVAARRHGVAAITLDRGGAVPGGPRAPWSLAAAKSLSYAPNTAALRHAEHVGAQDVVFVDADGSVLEGPRSTVLLVDDDGALLTPPTALPILPGTTMRAVFEQAREHGLACREESIGIADLRAAQGVWLLSSVTLAARVHTLDGTPLRMAPLTADVGPLVDAAILRTD